MEYNFQRGKKLLSERENLRGNLGNLPKEGGVLEPCSRAGTASIRSTGLWKHNTDLSIAIFEKKPFEVFDPRESQSGPGPRCMYKNLMRSIKV